MGSCREVHIGLRRVEASFGSLISLHAGGWAVAKGVQLGTCYSHGPLELEVCTFFRNARNLHRSDLKLLLCVPQRPAVSKDKHLVPQLTCYSHCQSPRGMSRFQLQSAQLGICYPGGNMELFFLHPYRAFKGQEFASNFT